MVSLLAPKAMDGAVVGDFTYVHYSANICEMDFLL